MLDKLRKEEEEGKASSDGNAEPTAVNSMMFWAKMSGDQNMMKKTNEVMRRKSFDRDGPLPEIEKSKGLIRHQSDFVGDDKTKALILQRREKMKEEEERRERKEERAKSKRPDDREKSRRPEDRGESRKPHRGKSSSRPRRSASRGRGDSRKPEPAPMRIKPLNPRMDRRPSYDKDDKEKERRGNRGASKNRGSSVSRRGESRDRDTKSRHRGESRDRSHREHSRHKSKSRAPTSSRDDRGKSRPDNRGQSKSRESRPKLELRKTSVDKDRSKSVAKDKQFDTASIKSSRSSKSARPREDGREKSSRPDRDHDTRSVKSSRSRK